MKDWFKKKLFRKLNVSFSKAGDDIQLMKFINRSAPGAYVDIGCWDPVRSSNTYYFHLRGWQGICIDPNPQLAAVYKAQRPGDLFVNAAIGTEAGALSYYMLEKGYDSMNTLDRDFIRKHGLEDKVEHTLEVPVRTLASVLEEHLDPGARLDFFDVDVEGFDLEVLKSNDWNRFRPGIIVSETDHPLEADLHSDMTRYLADQGYGLAGKSVINGDLGNLFYVRK